MARSLSSASGTPAVETPTSFGQVRETLLDKLFKKLRVRRVAAHIPKQSVLADLGCGFQGHFLGEISGRIAKGIGYDKVVSADPPSQNISLSPCRIDECLPLSDGEIDVVTALAVLEHLDSPENLCRETYRVLKPGGVFIFTTPSPRAKPVLEFMAFRLKVIDEKEIADHKRYYDKGRLMAELIRSGFEGERISLKHFQLGCNIFGIAKK